MMHLRTGFLLRGRLSAQLRIFDVDSAPGHSPAFNTALEYDDM